MLWFNFDQNNSGGSFVRDAGVDCDVFIQAPDRDAALRKAEEVGVYFDGCADGRDCDCCGDRWCSLDAENGAELPSRYDRPVVDGKGLSPDLALSWRGGAVFHFADGRVLRSYENLFGQPIATPADFGIFDVVAAAATPHLLAE